MAFNTDATLCDRSVDPLAIDDESLLTHTYAQRRARLEALQLDGPAWSTPDSFDDGEALYAAVCERGLESVVTNRCGRCTGRGSEAG